MLLFFLVKQHPIHEFPVPTEGTAQGEPSVSQPGALSLGGGPPLDGQKVVRAVVSISNGDGIMSEVHKVDLELRIEEDRHKIEEISAFRDDPKIDKIIRALQKQIAQDSYRLSSMDGVPQR
jgi:hypothetical protein